MYSREQAIKHYEQKYNISIIYDSFEKYQITGGNE